MTMWFFVAMLLDPLSVEDLVRTHYEKSERMRPAKVLLLHVAEEDREIFGETRWSLLDMQGQGVEILFSQGSDEGLLMGREQQVALMMSDRWPGNSWYAFIQKGREAKVFHGLPDLNAFARWAFGALSISPEGIILGREGAVLQRYKSDCGVAAAAMLLERSGYRVELEDLYEALHPDPDGGFISLLELQRVLNQMGITSQGYRGNIQLLNDRDQAAILLYGKEHFVLYLEATDDFVFLIDPLVGRMIVKKSDFVSKWGGVLYYVES